MSSVTNLMPSIERLPNPDFEVCTRLSCPGLRAKLLVLAGERIDAWRRDPTAAGP
jgi:hypothetical protein